MQYTIEDIDRICPEAKDTLNLNQSQSAKIIGVSNGLLDLWRKQGVGPNYIETGTANRRGRVLYPKQSLADFLNNKIIVTN